MSFTYVIPDIHGRDDLLNSALADISAHRRGDGGVIVMIGDYVDKGPHSRQVVERLRSGIAGWHLVAEGQSRCDDGGGAAGSCEVRFVDGKRR
jgi:serine/threonine protein phosphatase 1